MNAPISHLLLQPNKLAEAMRAAVVQQQVNYMEAEQRRRERAGKKRVYTDMGPARTWTPEGPPPWQKRDCRTAMRYLRAPDGSRVAVPVRMLRMELVDSGKYTAHKRRDLEILKGCGHKRKPPVGTFAATLAPGYFRVFGRYGDLARVTARFDVVDGAMQNITLHRPGGKRLRAIENGLTDPDWTLLLMQIAKVMKERGVST